MTLRADELTTREITRETFRSSYESLQPLVIADGARSWAAYRKWTPSYLVETLAGQIVKVKYNANGVFDYNDGVETGRVESLELPFGEAAPLIMSEEGNRYYIQQQEIRKHYGLLVPDLDMPELVAPERITDINLWFGGAGCKTPLHFDRAANFIVQIFGSKHLMLFGPQYKKNLYPALGARLPHCSRINVFAPDYGQFPLYEEALPGRIDVTMEPGNTLYIPAGWWHAVESLGATISINYWHAP